MVTKFAASVVENDGGIRDSDNRIALAIFKPSQLCERFASSLFNPVTLQHRSHAHSCCHPPMKTVLYGNRNSDSSG